MLSPASSRPAQLRSDQAGLRQAGVGRRHMFQRRDIWLPLIFFAIGFTPITSLALALFAIVPLHVSSVAFVLPAAALAVLLGLWHPRYGRLALQGYAIGLVAVLVYDFTRVPGIVTGMWRDFIPNIGALLLQRQEGHAGLGYTWRWLGNGAGMGMAFFMTYPLVSRRLSVWVAGILFGVGVWMCLLATLLLAPAAQALLFRLTPVTFGFSLFGHLVYGGALALIMWRTGLNLRPHAPDSVGDRVPAAVPDPVVALGGD